MFKKVWSLRGHDLRQWLFYNVFLGLLPVWLSWFGLSFCKTWRFEGPFLDGTFLVFTATLSGASLSFFTEDLKANLKRTERLIYNWLIVVLVLGSTGFATIVTLKEFAPAKLHQPIIFSASTLILLAGTWFNLNLAAVRVVGMDPDLKAQLTEEPTKVAAAAKKATEVDGVKL